ncbi:peptidyl-prolyl cis-trans isomerase FKBP17-1, chloroplastic-like isoform X1 [Panicum virgatum]|uniref:peptidyl-prolyl cis-trans isomerase FKBP17-1, chloroplastic-like isoform X1 n=1 Tax=Panicum virgatum TaxID=38727 RepID=UPI0019D61FB6|nr:peptidyl-prolyl cis-trans isomerase FKBP17-1, chloroplastic-like isoform X1 [Panicum virgatum]
MVTTAVTAVAGAVPPPPKGKAVTSAATPPPTLTRRHLLVAGATASALRTAPASAAAPKFAEIPGSGGVKALDLREGSGEVPADGDQVATHYYGRLAAKQGWRFDSTYDHKDETGDPMPFVFTIGSGKVIPGIEAAVKSMRVGGLRRVIIPPSQGYQNTSQEPIPPNFFDRQRLIFNPTRLANGEGSTLGTLIFDIDLINIRQRS